MGIGPYVHVSGKSAQVAVHIIVCRYVGDHSCLHYVCSLMLVDGYRV